MDLVSAIEERRWQRNYASRPKAYKMTDVARAVTCASKRNPRVGVKSRRSVNARYVCVALLYMSGYTLKQIADFLGYTDHTTVIHALEQIQCRYPDIMALLSESWNELQQNSNEPNQGITDRTGPS